MLVMLRRSTISDKIKGMKGNIKQSFSYVRKLTGQITDNQMPAGKSDIVLADEFANHLMQKIQKIRNYLSQVPEYIPSNDHVPELSEF